MPAVMKASTMKSECHPKATVMYPPMVGAIIGETATTSVIELNACAVLFTGKRSRTNVWAATMPAHPPNA
jgi:hypothetical protein